MKTKGKFHIVPSPALMSRRLCGGPPSTINIIWLNHRDIKETEISVSHYKLELVCKNCLKVLRRMKRENSTAIEQR